MTLALLVNGDIGRSPFCEQLSGKRLPAGNQVFVVTRPKHKVRREFSLPLNGDGRGALGGVDLQRAFARLFRAGISDYQPRYRFWKRLGTLETVSATVASEDACFFLMCMLDASPAIDEA